MLNMNKDASYVTIELVVSFRVDINIICIEKLTLTALKLDRSPSNLQGWCNQELFFSASRTRM